MLCFHKIFFIVLIGFSLFLLSLPVSALEGLNHNFQFHGFLSQGYVLTSDNNYYGGSDDDGSFDFREIGVNASYRPIPLLQFSAQILSRFAGESDDGDVRLDYGFVDCRFLDKDAGWAAFRIGRIKTPYGLYNETRDVAATRPSIFLPQSIYFDRGRDLALSADGIQLNGEYRTKYGNLFLHAGAGKPKIKGREIEASLLGSNLPGDLDDEISYNARLMYEKEGGRLRFAFTWAQLNIDYDSSGSYLNDPDNGSIRFEPCIISAQLNEEKWSLTAEYALRKVKYKEFGCSFMNRTITGESYYLQASYRFLRNWEGMVRYDLLFSDKDDPNGTKSERPGHPHYSFFAKDLTFGLRWDITKSLMLRGEYHYVNGTAWLTHEDNQDASKTREYWNLFSIMMSYYF